ncbi:hypothetical protein CL614_07915 [archaeon]|nr:hypothetical protein [archaeon]
MDWYPFFPHETPREHQQKAIDFTLDKFLSEGKKFVVIEAGTGVGKSAVGYTLGKVLTHLGITSEAYESGTYFLTTQKILQEQYVRDFGKPHGHMSSVQSSTNYRCKYYKKNNCAESLRALKTASKDSAFFRTCVFNCTYKTAKEEFLKSKESVTNFPYFLAETTYAGKIKPRQFLVIDEAHNVDTELSKFIEISVSERFCQQILKLQLPKLNTQAQAWKWINEIYAPKLNSHFKHMEKMLEKLIGTDDKLQEFVKIAKQFEILDKHNCKLRRFIDIYQKENWIFNFIDAGDKTVAKIEFKPIDIAPFAEQMLFRFGEKVIMMSATILNKSGFCELLGLEDKDVAFISLPSPFPKENRPVIVEGIGSMSAANIQSTLPNLGAAVQEILKNHKNEKGIIHCHTFRIAKFLYGFLKDRRVLIHNSQNRDIILERHMKSKKPTVLLSPSMTEGVDLSYDSSRFQIICKVPFPYLGDKLIRKKMHKWKWWYAYRTAKTIVQASGRSIRSENDSAVTYIIDSDFRKFSYRHGNLFPSSFTECIVK